jgi:TetR/AcrR family transcriptional repressor of nem operon
MRYPPDRKQRTRERIQRAAGRLFRKQGYAATGIDAVMASAQMTPGGFYSHFRSKEDLLAETLDAVFTEGRNDQPARLEKLQGHAWLRAFVSYYLSEQHRGAPERGCPMASLAAEVSRIGGQPRAVFERHLRRVIESISQQYDPQIPDRKRAIAAMAQCLGGLMLARAVGEGKLSEEILTTCRRSILDEIARIEK